VPGVEQRSRSARRPGEPVSDVGPTEMTVARTADSLRGSGPVSCGNRAPGPRRARARQQQVEAARRAFGLYESLKALADPQWPGPLDRYSETALTEESADATRRELRRAYNQSLDEIVRKASVSSRRGPRERLPPRPQEYSYKVRDRVVAGDNYTERPRAAADSELAVPKFRTGGARSFTSWRPRTCRAPPFTPVVSIHTAARKRDPTRMFAGEGPPERTNRRFHYLAGDHGAARLSTAFDSTTLYG